MTGVLGPLFGPGTVPWLLRHEIRVAVRGFAMRSGRSNRGRAIRFAILGLLFVGGGGFFGWMISGGLVRHPPPPDPLLYLGLEAAMTVLGLLMLAQTLTMATQAFYVRNDLDLLLSSPLPPQRLLTVRALGIAVLACTLYVALASCVAIPALIRGAPRWLSLYVVIADLALLATSLGLILAMALFRTLGPRRTRVVAQVLAAVLGSAAFLASQARNFVPRATWERWEAKALALRHVGYDVNAPYSWPARAVLGDPLPLLALTVLCAGAFILVTSSLGRRFGADAAAAAGFAEAEGPSRRRSGQADKLRFAAGPMRALARKDTRLLVRDPWLLSQMLLQLLYFVPLAFLVFKGVHTGGAAILAIAAPLTFLSGQLAGNLTWVMVAAEDSAELIAVAPIPPSAALRAKLIVALTPVAVLAVGPLLAIAWINPLKGLLAALCWAGACVTAALINIWYAKPANRKDMMRRRNSSGIMGVVEVLILFVWGGAAYLMMQDMTALALIPIVVIGVLMILLRRPIRYGVAVA